MPTSYKIYQTYLRAPAAVIRLFEQALGTQAIYRPPGPNMQQSTIKDSVAKNMLAAISCAEGSLPPQYLMYSESFATTLYPAPAIFSLPVTVAKVLFSTPTWRFMLLLG